MIISVVNLKGGAGKTTLSTNLTFALSRKYHVLLIDTDLQRSASQWYENRKTEQDNFSVISITEPGSLKKQIPVFKTQYDHIIIDGAPQLDLINATNIFIADLVIIPVMPSPYDIWATETILERITAAREIQPGKQAAFLLNRVNDQTSLSKDAAEALKSFGFPVFKTKLRNRVVYADSASLGQSVLESSNSKAKAEFTELYKEIEKIIRKGK